MNRPHFSQAIPFAFVLLPLFGCGDLPGRTPSATAREPVGSLPKEKPIPPLELATEDLPVIPDRALTWREIPLPAGSAGDVVAFSKDGKLIATTGGVNIHVASAETGELITRMRLPHEARDVRLAFSDDGKTLVSGRMGNKDDIVRFWDTTTGKQLRELTLQTKKKEWAGADGPFLDLSPGAERIVASGYGEPYGHVDILNAKDGSLIRRIDAKLGERARFSRDGELVMVCRQMHFGVWNVKTGDSLLDVEVWNLGTGKHLIFPDAKENAGAAMFSGGFLSADNKYLVSDAVAVHEKKTFLHVWRLGVGAKGPVARVPAPAYGWPIPASGVMSPNGRTLAVCSSPEFGIYDLIRGEYRTEFKAPSKKCTQVLLAPDGVTLAVVGESTEKRAGDGELYSVYLTRFPKVGPPIPWRGVWTPAEATFLWEGVSSRNEFRREYCTRTLNSDPARAVAIAREQLRPMPAAELERTKAMIQKLDDNDPDVRDHMTLHLHGSVYTFESHFRALPRDAKPGEIRNRVTSILGQFHEIAVPPYLEPQIRQIMFLEQLGTPAARNLLGEIAAGAPGARITDEADAALKRLNRK